MAEIVIREDDTYIYADITVVPPQLEIYCELKSKASGDNPSTEGITAGLHRTSDENGAVTFRAPKSFLLEDLPRDVTVTVSHEVAGATETFAA